MTAYMSPHRRSPFAADAQRHDVRSPAIVFIGEAAGRAATNAWYQPERFVDARNDWLASAQASIL